MCYICVNAHSCENYILILRLYVRFLQIPLYHLVHVPVYVSMCDTFTPFTSLNGIGLWEGSRNHKERPRNVSWICCAFFPVSPCITLSFVFKMQFRVLENRKFSKVDNSYNSSLCRSTFILHQPSNVSYGRCIHPMKAIVVSLEAWQSFDSVTQTKRVYV